MIKIDIAKIRDNPNEFEKLIESDNNGNLVFLLDKLGKLPDKFDKSPLLKLASHQNSKIRTLAIKNLAKLSDNSLLLKYVQIVESDESSDVRREAVSAIGRLRDENSIEYLTKFLDSSDPEVVLQSIRGLLVFKNNEVVKSNLNKLKKHDNEIVREVINKEFYNDEVDEKNHPSSPDFMKNVIVHGDVLDIMKDIPNNSIHLTFTSPPYYNARDYSNYRSYQEYLDFLEKTFKEVFRVTKDGRFFLLNTSPIIIARMSRSHASKRYPIPYDIHSRLIKMGWEFIDDIVWVKPEASVKNRNAGFLQHRKPLAYKPNARTECVMVYRKKTNKLIDWNIKQYPREIVEKSKIKDKYESSNVWAIDPSFDKTHSAIFPVELCDRVIRFYSFIGDLIFDPFAGSGTLGKSAVKLNRFFFLTEKESKYIERIRDNVGGDSKLSAFYKKPTFLSANEFVLETKDGSSILSWSTIQCC